MRTTRLVLAALALAVAAACSNSPTAPDSAELGKLGSGQAKVAADGPSFGKLGSGQ